MDAKRMETETVEALRVAQTALKIVAERKTTEGAAQKLMDLFRTLTRMEMQCVAVVLAAATMITIELSSRLIVEIFAERQGEPAPDWFLPAITRDLNAFVQKGIDPDDPRTRELIQTFIQTEQARKHQEGI